MFVLDEPSIGLHPQDMDRVNSVMKRLRRAGNTLVVVEHDPQVMLAADRIIDMGPGPGANGGRIVFDGTPEELKKARTLTVPTSAVKEPSRIPPKNASTRPTRRWFCWALRAQPQKLRHPHSAALSRVYCRRLGFR